MFFSIIDSLSPLLDALNLAVKFKLEFMETLVLMHIAHVNVRNDNKLSALLFLKLRLLQMHLELFEDGITILRRIMPLVLAHNSVFESSRAHALMAKIQVANWARKRDEEARRTRNEKNTPECDGIKPAVYMSAMKSLEKAGQGYQKINNMFRAKEVLYTMVSICICYISTHVS